MKKRTLNGYGIISVKVEFSVDEARMVKDRITTVHKILNENPKAIDYDDRQIINQYVKDLEELINNKMFKEISSTVDLYKALFEPESEKLHSEVKDDDLYADEE